MPAITENPFTDPDQHAIWEMLVRRDIEGFLAGDWEAGADDFIESGFIGLDGRFSSDPDTWQITFPSLATYREAWLAQSRDFARTEFLDDPCARLFEAMQLTSFKFTGDVALVHKEFDGAIRKKDGGQLLLRWLSLFFCRREAGRWRIAGFVGYLPNPACTKAGSAYGL